jgi:DNA-binding response OmpR family regulator
MSHYTSSIPSIQTIPTILIVEDDPNTAALVAAYVEKEGFRALVADDGEQGLRMALDRAPSLVVLDVMLPKMDGWQVCRKLRRKSDVPIVMLTAREEESERVLGLSLGADDYVVKPFSPRELVERIKAILRRARPRLASPSGILTRGEVTMDVEKHRVTVGQTVIDLTGSEYKLLHVLMSSPGRVFSRDELLDRFYPDGEVVVDRVIDVHIGKLRQKIESNPSRPKYIQTVRGFGYRFSDGEDT